MRNTARFCKATTSLLFCLALWSQGAAAHDEGHSGIDTHAMLGGAVGGGAGAIIGSEMDGRNGAIVGSVIGAAAGVAIATSRPHTYHTRYDDHDDGRSWHHAHGKHHRHDDWRH
jgi:hypothetical protein